MAAALAELGIPGGIDRRPIVTPPVSNKELYQSISCEGFSRGSKLDADSHGHDDGVQPNDPLFAIQARWDSNVAMVEIEPLAPKMYGLARLRSCEAHK